jgi:hypothetical protein
MAEAVANALLMPILDFEWRIVVDDLGNPDPILCVRLDDEKSCPAAYRREVALRISLQDPEIAVCAAPVAPVTGNNANAIRQDASPDQFAKGVVRNAVIMELRHH